LQYAAACARRPAGRRRNRGEPLGSTAANRCSVSGAAAARCARRGRSVVLLC